MKFQLIIIMLVIFNHFYAQPLPLKNLSNSSQHSHSSNLIFGTQDQLYVFWIEGDNRIHSRSFSNHTWSNTNQIYLSDRSSTIEELNVSSNGNSICLYWTENNVRASIMTGNFAGDSLTYIDTVYQTAHSIERIISRQGNYLGWLEKISNFSSRAGLNVMTVSNENISLIDSCDIWFDFTMAPDDSGKLYVFWCKYGFDIHFVSLIDSLNWSPATSIVSSYSFKDLDCTFNPIHQNFNISIAGNLFTGPYSNGIVYVEGRDSSWSAFEEIMPVGWSSPFSKFDISEFPQVLFQADGTCLTVFQNTFNGQSTTDRNIYRAQKNNSGGWTVEKDLFPEPVLLNSSGLNIDDSLFCTFEKGNDVYMIQSLILCKKELSYKK